MPFKQLHSNGLRIVGRVVLQMELCFQRLCCGLMHLKNQVSSRCSAECIVLFVFICTYMESKFNVPNTRLFHITNCTTSVKERKRAIHRKKKIRSFKTKIMFHSHPNRGTVSHRRYTCDEQYRLLRHHGKNESNSMATVVPLQANLKIFIFSLKARKHETKLKVLYFPSCCCCCS